MTTCKAHTVDFIAVENDAAMLAVYEEITTDLAKIGITVNTRFVSKAEYVDAERKGDYNMLFTRTWGAPYDPHSYLTSWAVPSHVEYSASQNLEPPLTRDILMKKITDAQQEVDPIKLHKQWHEILNDIHQQAMFLPLWGSRIPSVVNRRLSRFSASNQAYTYPLDSIRVDSGPHNVTVAPGSGGSLFKSVGKLNPHQYFPNQIFVSNWMYEGLVSYGEGGEIIPALAASWTTEKTDVGQRVTFKLREGVKFHDGTDWNCTVAKLNFDHILSETVKQRHSWFGTGKYLKSWVCNTDGDFVLETSAPFYPLLQELSYARPLVFASAAAFSEGTDSHPDKHNSCVSGDFGTKWAFLEETVVCLGLKAPIGTGPFKFADRRYLAGSNDTIDAEVVFARHDQYWGGAPDIENLIVKHYGSQDEVEAALRSGELDMAIGSGPLTAKQVYKMKFYDSDKFDVRHTEVLQNALAVVNTAKAPTDDINVRKAIMHAVNKAVFVADEFDGLEQPVSQLLPLSAPFSNVDLNPKWNYDLDKAKFLNCPPAPVTLASAENDGLDGGVVAGLAIGGFVLLALFLLVFRMIFRERQGKPMFTPLVVKGSAAADPNEDKQLISS